MEPTVYFIVPVYKVEQYLRRCVDSLLAQSYSHCRIILVNDGSPDNSGEICVDYRDRFQNVQYIEKPNGGLSDARNAGIAKCLETAADEDFIAFVDSDDFLHPEFAGLMLNACRTNNCLCAQCSFEHGSGDSFSDVRITDDWTAMSSKDALLGYRLKSQCCMKMFSVRLFENERMRVGVWNEDEYITYRLVYNAGRIVFSDMPLYYYYQHPGSIMHSVANKLKDNPHNRDWLVAYAERIAYFTERGESEQITKTHEKICSDIILRYSEQKCLPADQRESAVDSGEFLSLYREHYAFLKGASFISRKRSAVYFLFRYFPWTAVAAAKIRPLRK